MLFVIATLTTSRPRDLHDTLRTRFDAFRAEDGCLFYSVGIEDEAAGRLIAVEKWRDREAMDRHNASPELTSVIAPFAAGLGVEIEIIDLPA